jgi:hypothetical protein
MQYRRGGLVTAEICGGRLASRFRAAESRHSFRKTQRLRHRTGGTMELTSHVVDPRQSGDETETASARLPDTSAAVADQPPDERAATEFGHDRLEKAIHAVSAGVARLERKLDRILALSVESARARNRW